MRNMTSGDTRLRFGFDLRHSFVIRHSDFIIPLYDIHSSFSGVFRASKIVCMAGWIWS